MNKPKQSPSSNDGLGNAEKGKQLIDSAKIIANSFDPVKLIAAQIQYQMFVAKIYRQNARMK